MDTVDDSVKQLMSSWEVRLRASGATKGTVHTRRGGLRSFIAHGYDPVNFEPDDVLVWLADQVKPWTRLTYYSTMSSWVDHLRATGAREDNPLEFVRRPKTPIRTPRPISDDDLAELLALSTGHTQAFVILAAFSGLRVSEIARMRGEIISEQTIRVVGKGQTELYLSTHPLVWSLAQNFPRRGWWFPARTGAGHIGPASVSRALGRLMDKHGVDATAHQLRHSFATRLLRQGVDVRIVQQSMRHASLQTTAGYLLVDDIDMAVAIRKLTSPKRKVL